MKRAETLKEGWMRVFGEGAARSERARIEVYEGLVGEYRRDKEKNGRD